MSSEQWLMQVPDINNRPEYDQWVVRWWPYLWSMARAETGNRDDADEAVQQTFLQAHRIISTGQLRPETNLKAYLRQVLINVLKDRYKEKAKNAKYVLLKDLDSIVASFEKHLSPDEEGFEPYTPPRPDSGLTDLRKMVEGRRDAQGRTHGELGEQCGWNYAAMGLASGTSEHAMRAKTWTQIQRVWKVVGLLPVVKIFTAYEQDPAFKPFKMSDWRELLVEQAELIAQRDRMTKKAYVEKSDLINRLLGLVVTDIDGDSVVLELARRWTNDREVDSEWANNELRLMSQHRFLLARRLELSGVHAFNKARSRMDDWSYVCARQAYELFCRALGILEREGRSVSGGFESHIARIEQHIRQVHALRVELEKTLEKTYECGFPRHRDEGFLCYLLRSYRHGFGFAPSARDFSVWAISGGRYDIFP